MKKVIRDENYRMKVVERGQCPLFLGRAMGVKRYPAIVFAVVFRSELKMRVFRSLFCLLLLVAVTVTSAKADLIDVIGEQVISTTSIDLFEAGNATTAGGNVFFSGRTTQTCVVGGVQSYNTVTGELSGVTAAQSLHGLGGNSGITEIIRQNDGSILYVCLLYTSDAADE